MQKHSSSEVKWLGSRKGPSVDDLQTIGCSSGLGVDRKLRAKHRTPPQQKHPWHGSASVIDLKFSTRSWRVSNHHRNRDGCLAGLSGFWFWNTFSVSGASAPALLLSRLYKKKNKKNLQLHAAPVLWSSSFFFSSPGSVRQSSQPCGARAS